MAKITFLGSGSAFTMTNYQSSFVYHGDNGRNLLVDCGTDIRHSLHHCGLSHIDIHGVYISHLHADHVGGLEFIGYMSYFDPRYVGKPKVFIPEYFADEFWDESLKAGMKYIQDSEELTADFFFDVEVVSGYGSFMWDDNPFYLIQTKHIKTQHGYEPSYGLEFNLNGKTVFFTSDTMFCPESMPYNGADIIFHDCETAYNSGVHSHYNDLKTLPKDVKSKMWLYHYNDGALPVSAVDGFKGYVIPGQEFI